MKRFLRLGGYFVASVLTLMFIICFMVAVIHVMQLLAAYTAATIGGTALTEFIIYMLMFCVIVSGIITFIDRDKICKED